MKNNIYLAGLDIGTTGVKVLITDLKGNVVGFSYREYPCTFPFPGWVEQNVEDMWDKICDATKEVITKTNVKPDQIKSLGVSSQRGTFIVVDKNMRPLMNSIVWSDARASKEVQWIKKEI